MRRTRPARPVEHASGSPLATQAPFSWKLLHADELQGSLPLEIAAVCCLVGCLLVWLLALRRCLRCVLSLCKRSLHVLVEWLVS